MKGHLPQIILLAAAAAIVAAALMLPGALTEVPVPTAAQEQPVTTETAQQVSFADPADINDAHLRDVISMYENDDPYDVVTMYLTVQTGNAADGTDHTWEEVNTYSAYYYDEKGIDRYKVAALLQVGDETGPLPGALGYGQVIPNATVQIRGQTSSKNSQKNYKISLLDHFGSWNGQKTIALNKHQGEGLRFRNKLAYDLMAEIPQIMSLRTQFVHLYVRDLTGDDPEHFVDYGLYTQVEQLNKTALNAHGLDKNGHLYKINNCEFYEYDGLKLVTDPGYNEAAFEYMLETKGSNDHTKLLEMVKAVNDYTISSDEVLDTYFDRENLAYWMAFMILTGNSDTQNRNFYIYSPLNSRTWYVYPWDNDAMLMESERSIRGKDVGTSWEVGISNYWGNLLFRRALMSSSYRSELDAAINDLRTNYLTPEHLNEMIQGYGETVQPYLYRMPDRAHAPLTPDGYALVLESVADEIESNYQRYLATLQSPMPFYVGVPEYDGSTLTVQWDLSYDMPDSEVTYNVILARDYEYQDVLFRQNGLRLNTVSCELDLEPGQYFLYVNAVNSGGYTMSCFDYYVNADSKKVYGTCCFYLREDGTIDVYAVTEG